MHAEGMHDISLHSNLKRAEACSEAAMICDIITKPTQQNNWSLQLQMLEM